MVVQPLRASTWAAAASVAAWQPDCLAMPIRRAVSVSEESSSTAGAW